MKKKLLKWIPVVLWCMLIFYFSHQDGDESGNTSELVKRLFLYIGIDVNSLLGEVATLVIRKGAHFTEYFILCLLVHNACYNSIRLKRSILTAFLFTAAYAVSDEIHQYFVPGRVCAVKDMLIDSSGGGFAALVIYLRHKRGVRR